MLDLHEGILGLFAEAARLVERQLGDVDAGSVETLRRAYRERHRVAWPLRLVPATRRAVDARVQVPRAPLAPTGRERAGAEAVLRDPLDLARAAPASYRRHMLSVGDLVRPARRGGSPWRLGVVERVYPDGRVTVRSYVAPPRSYEGSAATHDPDEVEVVPREDVERALRLTQARRDAAEELARQIANALDAATKGAGPGA